MGANLQSQIGEHYFTFLHFNFFAHYVMYVMNLNREIKKDDSNLPPT